MIFAKTYLSEEPEYLEWPEDRNTIEHKWVRMRSEVTGEETHFNLIIIY